MVMNSILKPTWHNNLTKTSQIVIIYTHRAAPARIDVPENGKTREETTKEGMEHG
jgi:hypothetical protein